MEEFPEDTLFDKTVRGALYNLAEAIENAKPNDRTEKDRLYAIMMTDYQKMYAFFNTFISVEQ